MKTTVIASTLTALLCLPVGAALAADTQTQAQTQHQETIYGSQLMTPQERQTYQHQMRAAKTPAEQANIRNEHHNRMQERAKERGMALPAEPPAGGMGGGAMGSGGMGSGGMGGGGSGR
ncbi:MAG TPA: hypothetical protein PLD29_09610 [Halothiobacillus sp.]|nr:hypothetical protein [Halothiobacillus sp.]